MLTFSYVKQARKLIRVTGSFFTFVPLATLDNSARQRGGLGQSFQFPLDVITRMPGCFEHSVLVND